MTNLQINIFNSNMEWMGIVDTVQSLVHRTSWHEITNSEMTVSKTAQGVDELKIGRILLVNDQRYKALVIEELQASSDDQYWNFTLIPLKGILNYRITHPTDSQATQALFQSEAMMVLASSNLVSQTRDVNRKFLHTDAVTNMFDVNDYKFYGEIVSFTVDWKTGFLGDALVSIAKMNADTGYPIGWNVHVSDTYNKFRLDTYKALDRSVNQALIPPVVFSEEFGNIKNVSYTYSTKEWRNVAYIEWNNGTADQLSGVVNYKYGDVKGFNRKEINLDSSKKTTAEVLNEGKSELNKRPHIESFTAEILNNENTMSTYMKDWFLGDIVTIQSKHIKKDQLLSINAQITEIEEIYDSGEYSINVTFGEGKLSLIALIKNAIRAKKG
jgi:hypothetical protein